jgi:hypothetical protein
MKWLRIIAGLLLIAVTLVAPRTVQACPACTEMVIAAGDDADDTDNFAEAVNQSIYVMVSVPYAALVIVGFMVYRGVKKNAAYLKAVQETAGAPA